MSFAFVVGHLWRRASQETVDLHTPSGKFAVMNPDGSPYVPPGQTQPNGVSQLAYADLASGQCWLVDPAGVVFKRGCEPLAADGLYAREYILTDEDGCRHIVVLSHRRDELPDIPDTTALGFQPDRAVPAVPVTPLAEEKLWRVYDVQSAQPDGFVAWLHVAARDDRHARQLVGSIEGLDELAIIAVEPVDAAVIRPCNVKQLGGDAAPTLQCAPPTGAEDAAGA